MKSLYFLSRLFLQEGIFIALGKILFWFAGLGYAGNSTNKEAKILKKILKPSKHPLIWDIGANHGQYASSLIQYFPNARIFIFEPAKTCFEILNTKFAGKSDISIFQIAVGDSNQERQLYYDEMGSVLASLIDRKSTCTLFTKSEIVKSMTIDSFLSLNPTIPDFIKLDIEGFEYKALTHAKSILSLGVPIQFEFGSASIEAKVLFKDLWDLFGNYNYSMYRITPLGLRKVYIYRPVLEYPGASNYLAIKK